MTLPAPCAWQGSVSEFLATPEERVLSDLTAFLRETGAPQILAWDRSLRVLRDELRSCLPDAAGFALVLEFELPRSGGRRPDLIVLENGLVLVIEFKNRVAAEPADIAQVKGYVRDLEEYHAACRGKTLVPLLVPIGMDGDPETRDGVRIVPSRKLGAVIRELSKGGAGKRGDGEAFVRAPFEPLPALVEAARAHRRVRRSPRAWKRDRVLKQHRGVLADGEPTLEAAWRRGQLLPRPRALDCHRLPRRYLRLLQQPRRHCRP